MHAPKPCSTLSVLHSWKPQNCNLFGKFNNGTLMHFHKTLWTDIKEKVKTLFEGSPLRTKFHSNEPYFKWQFNNWKYPRLSSFTESKPCADSSYQLVSFTLTYDIVEWYYSVKQIINLLKQFPLLHFCSGVSASSIPIKSDSVLSMKAIISHGNARCSSENFIMVLFALLAIGNTGVLLAWYKFLWLWSTLGNHYNIR